MDDASLPLNVPEEEYEPDILTLEDEDGHEHMFEVIDAASLGENRYLAVVPYFEDAKDRLAEDAEMLIMRIGEENGEEYLDIVEDETELQGAGQMFMNRLSEVYNIDLEELEKQGRGEK